MNVKIEGHPAPENLTDGCLSCQDGTVQDPQTCWMRKGTAAPPPKLTPFLPGTPPLRLAPPVPPAPPGENVGAEMSKMDSVPARYVSVHTPLPNATQFNHDPYAKDLIRDEDCISDLLIDQGTTPS